MMMMKKKMRIRSEKLFLQIDESERERFRSGGIGRWREKG